jgi:NADPH:quinone reductase-like Zn-dependent oxidoreductase
VCSTGKVDLVRSLGADEVVDYTAEDFTLAEGRYDLILAANGFRPIRSYFRALKEGGRYVMAGGEAAQLFQALILGPWLSRSGTRKLQALTARPSAEDLAFIAKLFGDGALKPVIDRRYPLAELPAAIRYVQGGHAAGKVVLTME